ncbi:MAG: hypothetical protein JSU90_12290 [Nitrospiraceae bacterium]|nr:MAG: hypothetical protein JSU90_12290 [Nitrospiraceae bacterium]
MSRTRLLVILILILSAFLAAALYPSEKKRIRKVISGCREALAREDLEGIMEHLSFSFSSEYGGGYLQTKKRAELMFRRFDGFEVTADVMNIIIDRDRAEADLKVLVTARQGSEPVHLAGDAMGPDDIRLFLEKSPYDWKIIGIERTGQADY